MHNPTHLMQSRHDIYYFRYPISKSRCAKPEYLRVSLKTREPKEALQLAKALEYHVSVLVGNTDIKVLRECCHKVLSERRNEPAKPSYLTSETGTLRAVTGRSGANPYTLDNLVNKFIDINSNESDWIGKTRESSLAQLNVLTEILGGRFDVRRMDAERTRQIRDIVKLIPRNRNKLSETRFMPITEAIKIEGLQRISGVTVNKYLATYKAFFDWCVKENYCERNYFSKLKVKLTRADHIERMPFNAEQVIAIRNELDKGHNGLASKDYRYWGVLIAMYTGARLNEIAQIELADIQQRNGIWYFSINDDGENKRLKTAAAKRIVPIHNALLERGIIQYRDKLLEQGRARLLHELPYCKHNGYGKNLGRFFNELLLPRLGIKQKELSFHCWRHTVNTRLRQADVELTKVQTLIGHERSGGASEEYFNEGYTLEQLKEVVDRLVY